MVWAMMRLELVADSASAAAILTDGAPLVEHFLTQFNPQVGHPRAGAAAISMWDGLTQFDPQVGQPQNRSIHRWDSLA